MFDDLINDSRAIVAQKLPLAESELKTALSACLTALDPIRDATAQAHRTFVEKREQYRLPKDKEFTDFDRTTMLEAQVAGYMLDYELLAGLEKSLSQRREALVLLLQTTHGSSS